MLYVQQVSGSHATPSRIAHCLFYSGRFHLHTHKNVLSRNKDENLWLPIFTRCDRFLLFLLIQRYGLGLVGLVGRQV